MDRNRGGRKTGMGAGEGAVWQRRATTLRRGPGGNKQTFKPAPAGTELKQPELIEESRMFLRCHIVQQDTEQPRGPVKIAPPDRMPRVRSDAGIKHMTNFGLLLEPVDELQSVALMALEAHLKRAQSAMHEVAIVGAHAVSPVTRRILQPP